ncbi:hypothetical protein JCM3774_001277 [Rhodotorula dairenensis]
MTAHRRRGPPRPLLLAGSPHRDPSPAFGKIATYSHRLSPTARRRWSIRRPAARAVKDASPSEQHHTLAMEPAVANTAMSSGGRSPLSPAAESAELLRTIAMAEVSLRNPFPPRQPTRPALPQTERPATAAPAPAEVTVDIQPATPRQVSPPCGRARPRNQAGLSTAAKQSHRATSIHSVLSITELGDLSNGRYVNDEGDDDDDDEEEEDAVEVIRFEAHPGRSLYLRPDLTGASGLSIQNFEPHGRSNSSSSTETLVELKPVLLEAVAAESKPPGTGFAHLRSTSAPTEFVQPHAPPPHLVDCYEVPRSYICPWEAEAPFALKPAEEPHLQLTDYASREKPLPPPATASTFPTHCSDWRRKHAVTAALVLLSVLILTDLIVLNIRVWSLRDAYYDE